MIPAVGYLRVSDPKKKEVSIPKQKEIIQKWAKSRYKIIRWYIDAGRSGGKDTEKRTEFLRMIDDAESKQDFQAVLSYGFDRFGRLDTLEGAEYKLRLRNAGVYLDTPMDGKADWTTPTGQILDAVYAVKNNEYLLHLSKSVIDGKLRAASEGKPLGGQPPYGMARLIIDDNGEKRLIPRGDRFKAPHGWTVTYVAGDETEIQIVRWLFEEYLSKDISFHSLAQRLNERRIPSPGKKKWTTLQIQRTLWNRCYIGDYVSGKKHTKGCFYRLTKEGPIRNPGGKLSSNIAGSEDELIIAEKVFEPILERKLFFKVQKKMSRNKGRKPRSPRDGGHPLSGILICDHCGKTMLAMKRSNRKVAGTVYYCGSACNNPGATCGFWKVEEAELMSFLVDTLDKKLQPTELEKLLPIAKYRKLTDNRNDERRLAEIEKEIDRGNRRLVTIDDDEIVPGIVKEIKRLKHEMSELERRLHRPSGASGLIEYSDEWSNFIREGLRCIGNGQAGMAVRCGKSVGSVPIQGVRFREALNRFGVEVRCKFRVKEKRDRAGKYALERGEIYLDAEKFVLFPSDDRRRSALR